MARERKRCSQRNESGEKEGEGQKHNGTGHPNTGVIKWIF